MPSATQLADFTRCTHRVFLDANGDSAEKLPPSPELQRLWDEGREHEAEIIAALNVARVPYGPDERRRADTVALMRSGADLIYHAYLAAGDLVGEPDLLKRVDHATAFGAHGYVPVDVKNGRATKSTGSDALKPAYAIQLCAYAELLAAVQGWSPSEAFIIDQHGEWQPVSAWGRIRGRACAVRRS